MTATPQSVDVAKIREWLADGGEIAFVDVREEGQHGEGHPLLAVNLPYSRLEIDIGRSVPRLSCRIILVDDGDGVSEKAARRLAGLGYSDIRVLAGGAAAWDAAGYRLFPSSNVPSKAFAEIIEHQCATPAISAEELDRLRRSGQKVASSTVARSTNTRGFMYRERSHAPAPSLSTALPMPFRRPIPWSWCPAPGAHAASSARNP